MKVIKIVEKNTMKSQMIILHQYLETQMIKDLSEIMKTNIEDITEESVKKWVEDKSIEELKATLKIGGQNIQSFVNLILTIKKD